MEQGGLECANASCDGEQGEASKAADLNAFCMQCRRFISRRSYARDGSVWAGRRAELIAHMKLCGLDLGRCRRVAQPSQPSQPNDSIVDVSSLVVDEDNGVSFLVTVRPPIRPSVDSRLLPVADMLAGIADAAEATRALALVKDGLLSRALDLLALFDGQSISAITETAALVESAGNADRAKKALAMLAIVDSLRK